ncbi:hypothetical protein I316_07061 [Kwoniella heveanensis BCC8398]|uniref:Peroxisomal ATPase PEX1 n=1 Tax=Kwoniella heveanensis BCC8398 TaxID=1296120 RepID=A0A1B9GK05_9TREE|nr:hypothetical protein I316_07061 [Kwoniella heveanensis BCC8398]
MGRKAAVKYRSLRSNLIHLPLSLFAQLAQQQVRPQSIVLHLSPLSSSPSSSTQRQPRPAYLGWSGLAASSSLAQAGGGVESIEIDPEVALSLGWMEGTLVEISVIHNPTKAKSVSVTPLTSDDWEILEQHASFLENNLLSQLRAAQKGQEIDAWVAGKTKIRIRVDDTNPSCGPKDAVLINPDTEIYVAPRPRSSNGNVQKERQIIEPTSSSNPAGANDTSRRAAGLQVRLIPPYIAASWGTPMTPPGTKGGKIVLCSERTLHRLRPKIKLKASAEALVTISSMNVKELRPDEDSSEEQEVNIKETVATVVVWDEMPDRCVTLLGVTEEWESIWGRVRISAAFGNASKSRSGKSRTAAWTLASSPIPTQRRLPGSDLLIQEAVQYLSRADSSSSGLRPLLLLGNKGSGKSTIAMQVAEELGKDRSILAEAMIEDVGKLDPDARLASIKETMSEWLREATRRQPCCLVLDGLDDLLSPETELNSSSNPAILADHFCRLVAPFALPPGVLVFATATSSTSLHPMLNAKHIFGETLKIPPLTKEVRQEIIASLVAEKMHQINGRPPSATQVENDLDYVMLGGMTEGYSVADLNDLTGGTLQQAIIRCSQVQTPLLDPIIEDFILAQAAFTPLSLRGVSLQKSDVKWSDIGGLVEPRRVLRETLEWPTKYAQIFANCPLRLRSGLLLYGYPGCGKTLLASAVAKECGLNFISVKGPEILNKYIGASEKAVRDLFERASAAKPCVLFFDEFDSIAPKRGHDSTGVTDRVVNQMLTEMDGAQGLTGVYVLAATSRPDLIDPALLRPGRLDKSVLCDMPTASDRLDILQTISSKLAISDDVDWADLAERTEGMSGADLQAVVYNAHLEVVHTSMDIEMTDRDGLVNGVSEIRKNRANQTQADSPRANQKINGYTQITPKEVDGSAATRGTMTNRIDTIITNSERSLGRDPATVRPLAKASKPTIQYQHLLRSLQSTRPSVAAKDRKRLDAIYKVFASDRDGKMEDGDLGRETGTRMSLM